MAHFLEFAKHATGIIASFAAEKYHPPSNLFLAIGPVGQTELAVKEVFSRLNTSKREEVYGKVWELAKMHDPRIDGPNWGELHAFDNIDRLAKAMHRLGLLGTSHLHSLPCLPFGFGEGGIGSQYFSLGDKLEKEPATGQIGLINGMGNSSLAHAGSDAEAFSTKFAYGNNIHCVYHSTHQKNPIGDVLGFWEDVMRMKAVDGGSYTKTSYLAAQQMIDFLDANPYKKYLQVGVSEGAAHVNAALRIIQTARPDLLTRIRILNLCPAYFILPEQYENKIQVMNLVKREDGVINPWGINTDKIGYSKYILIVPHLSTNDNPHNQLSVDFQREAKPYIDEFMQSGNLYTPSS